MTQTLSPAGAGPGLKAARLFETPDNPVPAKGIAFFVETFDRVRLRAALWRAKEARGTVVLLQGRTETVEKYFETVGELHARGFTVLTLDWRGQGASQRLLPAEPLKGHVLNFSHYLNDLAAVLDEVENECPKPWHMLAHSMGGNIGLHALREWRADFETAVLSAPMTQILLPARPLIAQLARVAPAESFVPRGERYNPFTEPFEGNPVTGDARRFARNQGILKAHCELALGAPTWGWLRAAVAACAKLKEPGFLEPVQIPILILSGGKDAIVDNQSHRVMVARLALGQHVKIDGAKHELLMETDAIRAQFWARFDAFMSSYVKPLR